MSAAAIAATASLSLLSKSWNKDVVKAEVTVLREDSWEIFDDDKDDVREGVKEEVVAVDIDIDDDREDAVVGGNIARVDVKDIDAFVATAVVIVCVELKAVVDSKDEVVAGDVDEASLAAFVKILCIAGVNDNVEVDGTIVVWAKVALAVSEFSVIYVVYKSSAFC